ncbi:glutamate synthase-related protein [Halorubrum sp. BOL3-1]|uniref:glutamate synthase-related protein n=1 Tax=Halorubrum sp. BOL3-1 TaxID=2497325 RepID=UPI0019D68619|nr:glutamate synthase-related protein [Halorubrum sp. BOL3-1]
MPLDDGTPIDSGPVIGPNAENALEPEIPVFVSDMSFGALSEEAEVAISKGADGVAVANAAM